MEPRSSDGPVIALPAIVSTTNRKPGDSPTLLIVDDDPEIRMLLSELFRRAGFGVEVASDGAAAILFLEHHSPPDAIVLDLLMPGIIGSSVLAYLESRPSLATVPVAIVSSSPDLAPGGYPLFRKPLQFAPLLAFVRDACSAGAQASPA